MSQIAWIAGFETLSKYNDLVYVKFKTELCFIFNKSSYSNTLNLVWRVTGVLQIHILHMGDSNFTNKTDML